MRNWFLLSAALALSMPALAGPDEAMNKAGCMACHAKDRKVLGPSFKDIATKHKGQAGAAALLIDKVRKGGKGVYGPIPMPPNGAEKISDADLKAVVDAILAM